MSIYYQDGDLLDAPVNIIAHVVNCQGVMGKGIALQIKLEWPNVFKKYRDFTNARSDNYGFPNRNILMGECQIVDVGTDKYVANLFAQYWYGATKRELDYEAFYQSIEALKYFAAEHKLSVGFPYKIGAGLSGGNWNIIETMINEVFKDSDIQVLICHLEPLIWG